MLFIPMIDAAPRAAAAASGDSAASSAIAATTSALREATAAASAVPQACCGLSVVEFVIAPRLMRKSRACSGRRSLRRSIDMGLLGLAGRIRLRGGETRSVSPRERTRHESGSFAGDPPLAIEASVAKLDGLLVRLTFDRPGLTHDT